MALSTNYQWAEPDNSSLVKNGASDIRTLGNAIDTSLWNSGFGQAGKNKIINGDFKINQRGFSSTTSSGTYMFDRWTNYLSDGTVTYSSQSFTLGAAPVSGYEGTTFLRCVTSGQTLSGAAALLFQKIESVRTFANQPVTISFWAKAAAGTPKIAVEIGQVFGTGGSPSATVNTYIDQKTISTSWVRYSSTVTVPSISGKTIGTANNDALGIQFWTSAGSDFNSRTGSLGIQSATIDIWGVQVEYGSVATPFQTASGGSPQAELAMCQRYLPSVQVCTSDVGSGQCYAVTASLIHIPFPVTARVAPTGVTVNSAGNFRVRGATSSPITAVGVAFSTASPNGCYVDASVSAGLVAGNATSLYNAGSGTILFTGCEL
jgi:hypothetical protein